MGGNLLTPRECAPYVRSMSTPQLRSTLTDLEPERLESHRSLVAALRDLNLAAGTTVLDAEHLADLTAEIVELTAALDAGSTPRVVRAGFLEPRSRALTGGPLHLNVLNPALPGISVAFDHDIEGAAGVQAVAAGGDPAGLTNQAVLTVNALHEGPPDSVHGGTSAFLMDCMLGVLVQATGIPAVTGTLDVRYLRRTPLDQPVTLGARIVRRQGRKLTTEGWIEHDGVRTVEAVGVFITVGERLADAED